MKLESVSPANALPAAATSRDGPLMDLVGTSDAFGRMRVRLEQVAPTDTSVLLLGETGTGKGLAARAIHRLSTRSQAPFINVDCTALPATLIESELFGREKGAFTDARSTQPGRFELAHRGTIFLDEIGELPSAAQAMLLRILQSAECERLGSSRTIRVDVRIIAATNRNLIEEVRAGRFRRDLYYRLNVFPITMPPLRERQSDIPLLVRHLMASLAEKHHSPVTTMARPALEVLMAYDWPGNVRELENVLERAIITASGPTLQLLEPLASDRLDVVPAAASLMLADVERAHILRVLCATGWRIEGPSGAARALGLKPSTLRSRMRKLGLRRSLSAASTLPSAFVA